MDGKLALRRKKFPKFYEGTYGYGLYLKKFEKRRNHFQTKKELLVEHGEMRSFLTDKYPEARPARMHTDKLKAEAAEE